MMGEMVLAIMQMVGDDDGDNEDDIGSNEHEVSKSWINAIDRGGLWKIKKFHLPIICMHGRSDTATLQDRHMLIHRSE